MQHQITLLGKDLDKNGEISHDLVPLSLNLDDQEGTFGTPISLGVFQRLIANFLQFNTPDEKEKVMFVIDKQLLQILISSEKCKKLMVTKCSRGAGQESIAFVAADENNQPLGIIPNSGKEDIEGAGTGDFSSGEWVGAFRAKDMRPFLKKQHVENGLQDEFTFDLVDFVNSRTILDF
jgi:hypothetical protein